MAQELVKITINEKEVEVPAGVNVIEAANKAGIEIPHYCYHPQLSAPAVCRMCLVKVEGVGKLQPGCITPAREGLVIHTDTPEVRDAVREVLEFTLVNHPLDCPICDQAGECGLQDYYQDYGLYNSKMTLPRLKKPKVLDIGPTLMLDVERCILCSRCVRYADEVTETNEMAILQRGDHATITAVKPVDNPYSTNLADICPVGALTQKDFRFKCRVWYLKSKESVCWGCARGCNVVVDHYRNELQRIRPRTNEDVNSAWMCDEGRLLYKEVHEPTRLTRPMIRKASGLEEVGWDEAIDVASRLLQSRAKSVIGQNSAHMSNEDAYMLTALLALLGAPRSANLPSGKKGWEDVDDEMLRRSDRTPNRKGVGAFCGDKTFAELAKDQKARLALVVQEDVVPEPRKFDSLEAVIYMGTHLTYTAEAALVVLPIAACPERNGSFTNFEGRVQRFNRAIAPAPGVQPAWRVLNWLSQSLGGRAFQSVEEVFDAMAKETDMFGGLTFASLGSLGVSLDDLTTVSPSVEPSGDESTVTTR